MKKFDISDFRQKRVIRQGRNYVAAGEWDGLYVVLKKFRKATWTNHLIYTWIRKSKAERSFLNAHILLNSGFLTPKPLSWSVVKRFGIYSHSYYICSYLPGPTLREAIDKADNIRKFELLNLYADTMTRMAASGLLLKDSNLGNFILTQTSEGRDALALVDINRLISGREIKTIEVLHAIGRSGFRGDEFNYIAHRYAQTLKLDITSDLEKYYKNTHQEVDN
ncbi:MAG: hypothetical protein NC201_02920 [Prevotella sp.]|nr:hypothetical protein [Bacteroides sp.]MCM1366178.1 hypothetical protein [Prevotella sp.]MCM1436757.1 hypothetical protein [Prevotella sp.]